MTLVKEKKKYLNRKTYCVQCQALLKKQTIHIFQFHSHNMTSSLNKNTFVHHDVTFYNS